jgi:selenocysteine lyase/cysteine desulfurase
MAHARGALALVDAYQTVGALQLDLAASRPDFVVTGALKYLLGTPGVGLVYVNPELVERLHPRDIGWMAAANPFGVEFEHLEYAPGAARFQGGTFNIAGCYAADAALQLLLDIGVESIEQRTLGFSRRFIRGLLQTGVRPVGPVDDSKVGPMVAVPVGARDAHALQEHLRTEERVITAARGNALRFSFHFYHDESDVDAALDVVKRYF